MAFVEERVREIEHKYAHLIQDLLVLRLTEETLRLVLVLNDGTTLRVAERWQGGVLWCGTAITGLMPATS